MLDSQIEQIKRDADLLDVVGRDTHLKRVSTTHGGEWAGSCPFCGGTDRFRIQPASGLWWCRQCSPDERWQDVIAYVKRRDGVDFLEAAARLSNGALSTAFAPAKMERKPDRVQPANWHSATAQVVELCEVELWSGTSAARGALEWLHQRGLTDDTLKAWHVGFNAASGTIGGLWCESGITIPYFAGDTLHAVNVRRPDSFLRGHPQTDKYKMIAGSKRVLFGTDHLAGKPDVIIVEGEFDSMLIWQEARAVCDVVTMGAAKSMPGGSWLVYLVNGQRFYVATDNDDAGEAAAARWLELLGSRARRVMVPDGKDITDYWQAGGNLWAWVASLAPVVVQAGNHAAEDVLVELKHAEAGARLLALLDRWESADDPDDPSWRSAWATAQIEAGLPYYEVHHTELGEVLHINAWPACVGPGWWGKRIGLGELMITNGGPSEV